MKDKKGQQLERGAKRKDGWCDVSGGGGGKEGETICKKGGCGKKDAMRWFMLCEDVREKCGCCVDTKGG